MAGVRNAIASLATDSRGRIFSRPPSVMRASAIGSLAGNPATVALSIWPSPLPLTWTPASFKVTSSIGLARQLAVDLVLERLDPQTRQIVNDDFIGLNFREFQAPRPVAEIEVGLGSHLAAGEAAAHAAKLHKVVLHDDLAGCAIRVHLDGFNMNAGVFRGAGDAVMHGRMVLQREVEVEIAGGLALDHHLLPNSRRHERQARQVGLVHRHALRGQRQFSPCPFRWPLSRSATSRPRTGRRSSHRLSCRRRRAQGRS